MKAKDRLFRTADGAVVGEGDPRAAFLLAGPGDDIPEEHQAAAKAFLAGSEPEPDPEPEAKQADKAENKAVKSAPNKATAASKKK